MKGHTVANFGEEIEEVAVHGMKNRGGHKVAAHGKDIAEVAFHGKDIMEVVVQERNQRLQFMERTQDRP